MGRALGWWAGLGSAVPVPQHLGPGLISPEVWMLDLAGTVHRKWELYKGTGEK